MGSRAEAVLALMGFMWDFTLTPASQHLTDDEFWWEPIAGCYSVRPASSGAQGTVVGDHVIEYDHRSQSPVGGDHALTTIAWLVAHSWGWDGDGSFITKFRFLGGDRPNGDYASPPTGPISLPLTAADAVARLGLTWNRLQYAIATSSDDLLDEPWEWQFGRTTGWEHVLLILNEMSHHGAQICQIRDLYRHTVGPSGSGAILLG